MPTLSIISKNGKISIDKDLIADKILVSSKNGISYSNGSIISD